MRTIVNSGDAYARRVIVVNRFRVEQGDGEFQAAAHAALSALAARPGYVGGLVGRNLDDPDLWLITTTWADVGSYRRALSAYDVKVTAVPLLSRSVDEPSAYESVEPGGATNQQQVRTVN
jgi:quinol monooxygenase YgiN